MSEIRSLPAGKIIGIKTSIYTIMNPDKYDPKAIPAAWQTFFSKFPDSGLPETKTYYGAVIPNMDINSPMTYVAGVYVDSNHLVPAGLTDIEMPSGDYVCVKHSGPITELSTSYPKAYVEEFPKAGREMRNAPHLEIYESDKNPMDSDYEMIIAIPAK
jgi:predicted transcriptional regulator YdeE